MNHQYLKGRALLQAYSNQAQESNYNFKLLTLMRTLKLQDKAHFSTMQTMSIMVLIIVQTQSTKMLIQTLLVLWMGCTHPTQTVLRVVTLITVHLKHLPTSSDESDAEEQDK